MFLLVKSFKLVPMFLNKGPGSSRQIKLWFNLHGIILEAKPIDLDPDKELQGKLVVWRFKVAHFFVIFVLFFHCFLLSLLLKFCENRKRIYGLNTLLRTQQLKKSKWKQKYFKIMKERKKLKKSKWKQKKKN